MPAGVISDYIYVENAAFVYS
eukprot:SAG31_NODE_33303_length_345_cov_1.016260_1_plen_20_part_01